MLRFIFTIFAICFSFYIQCSIGFDLLKEESISKNLTRRADTIFANTSPHPEPCQVQGVLHLLDGLNTILEMDGNGTKTREYVTELGLDDILYEIQNGTYKYYHTDGLGSVTGITNETQQLIKRNYYRAYGEIYRSWGSNKSKVGFTGRDFNKDTGLIDLRARQYDPVIGRFISPDPFTRGPDDPRVRDMYKSSWYSKIHGELTLYTSFMKPNEFNRYTYANNNPVNYTDPLGLIPIDTIWDLANIAYDIVTGDKASLAADVAALAIPYVPAGITKIGKAAKFSRFMSKAELKAVEKTGLLRGGKKGETFFTTNKYRKAENAQKNLSLPSTPDVRVDFNIKNKPNVTGPTQVDPRYGQPGGGIEYITNDEVQVNIIRKKKLKK